MEENIFVVTVCRLLEQQKSWNAIIKDYFKIYAKQTINMFKKGECIKSKNFGRKTKSPFIIDTNFESGLVPEDNGQQNPNEPYTNKLQKHVACSYGYK